MQVTEDRKLLIAVDRSRKAALWQNKEIQWSELLDKLATTTRTRESTKEYASLSKAERDEIKDIGGFVGGYLKNGRRNRSPTAASSVWTRTQVTRSFVPIWNSPVRSPTLFTPPTVTPRKSPATAW